MNIAYRCEHCGTMLGTADLHDKSVGDSSWRARCPGCGKRISIPRVLTELPTPQIAEYGTPVGTMPPSARQRAPLGAASAGLRGADDAHIGGANSAAMGKVAALMPWMISVFFHMGIFLVMLFFILMSQMHKQIFEINVPEAAYLQDIGPAADPGTRGPGKDPNQASGKQEFSRKVNAGSIIDGAQTDKQVSIFGSSTTGASEISGFGKGGSGDGPGRVTFLPGSEAVGNIYHLVFVIDRSGSMIDSFDYLKGAMVDAINKLTDVQDFDIIMFSGGKPAYIEMGPKMLVPATEAYKNMAGEFMESVNAQSSTLAADAIRRGFDVLNKAGDRPGKLMILLTDACFDDADKVLAAFKERNADKKVLVSTYLYNANEEKAGKDIMEKIAKENGGKYKFFPTKEAN